MDNFQRNPSMSRGMSVSARKEQERIRLEEEMQRFLHDGGQIIKCPTKKATGKTSEIKDRHLKERRPSTFSPQAEAKKLREELRQKHGMQRRELHEKYNRY